MKVGVFPHGTAIVHASAAGVPRSQRVEQVRRGDATVTDFGSYIPTPRTVDKLANWATSRNRDRLRQLASPRGRPARRRSSGFPDGPVHARRDGEDYGALVDRLSLDMLIENDCGSIGGLGPDIRRRIRCVLLPAFARLADLPDDPHILMTAL